MASLPTARVHAAMPPFSAIFDLNRGNARGISAPSLERYLDAFRPALPAKEALARGRLHQGQEDLLREVASTQQALGELSPRHRAEVMIGVARRVAGAAVLLDSRGARALQLSVEGAADALSEALSAADDMPKMGFPSFFFGPSAKRRAEQAARAALRISLGQDLVKACWRLADAAAAIVPGVTPGGIASLAALQEASESAASIMALHAAATLKTRFESRALQLCDKRHVLLHGRCKAAFRKALERVAAACEEQRSRRAAIANLLHCQSKDLPRPSCEATAFALLRLGCADAATATDRIDREQRDAERRRGEGAVGELLGVLIRHGAVSHKDEAMAVRAALLSAHGPRWASERSQLRRSIGESVREDPEERFACGAKAVLRTRAGRWPAGTHVTILRRRVQDPAADGPSTPMMREWSPRAGDHSIRARAFDVRVDVDMSFLEAVPRGKLVPRRPERRRSAPAIVQVKAGDGGWASADEAQDGARSRRKKKKKKGAPVARVMREEGPFWRRSPSGGRLASPRERRVLRRRYTISTDEELLRPRADAPSLYMSP